MAARVLVLAAAACLAAGVCAAGAARPASHYLLEYRDLFKQSVRPLGGGNATYGLLPQGTTGSLAEHPDVAASLIGDSFVAPLAGVFNDIAHERGLKFSVTSVPSCGPFFDDDSMTSSVRDWPGRDDTAFQRKVSGRNIKCKDVHRHDMLALARASPAKVIFLATNWVASPQLWGAHNSLGAKDPVADSLHAIAATGKRIVLFGVVPGAHYDPVVCLLRGKGGCAPVSKVLPPFDVGAEEGEKRRMASRIRLRETLRKTLSRVDVHALKIGFIDPVRGLCRGQEECDVLEDGEPLYSDPIHLTARGARRMRADIEAALYNWGG